MSSNMFFRSGEDL